MNKIASLLLLCGVCGFAQTAETLYFRATMLPSNEVPPVNINASGSATIRAHVVRDSSGQITSGTVDFLINYAFPSAVTITGLHIHDGPAGVNSGVVLPTSVSAANPVTSDTGRGIIDLPAQAPPSNATALGALRGLVANPAGYYVNLHTTDNPAGVIRGQLESANARVLVGLMSPANEIPPVGFNASAVSTVTVITTRNASGALTSGQLIFDMNYTFPQPVTLTGYHIHTGGPTVNGPVIFNTGIGSGATSVQADVTGNLRRTVDVNLANAAEAAALQGLLTNPGGYYINVHTTEYPAGVARGQMRPTDSMTFPVTLLTSNEVPAITGLDASAIGVVTANTVRAEDGSIPAGLVTFDANYRFPAADVEFTGFHIHDGAAGTNGPVRINTGLSAANSVKSATGFGNIYRTVTVSEGAALATLNSMVRTPENHYVNLHTTVNPAGVVRSQLAEASTNPPVVSAVISANQDKNATTVAQGALISIYGANLARVATGLGGWQGKSLPDQLNGVAVVIGGQRARLMYVSPGQINAQVPFESPVGTQVVAVNNGSLPGPGFNASVAAVAPALFFTDTGGIVLKNADFSLVGPGNPAQAGDVLILYSTGLGQTTPAMQTGDLAPSGSPVNTASVNVTIGGKDADVIYSIAAPGYAGLYQTAVRMPAGVPAGTAAVVLKSGGATSNTVNIMVQ